MPRTQGRRQSHRTPSQEVAAAKWKQFWSLFLLGMIGVLSLAVLSAPELQRQVAAIPDFPRIPLPVLAMLAVVQPTILLAIAVFTGVSIAPVLGLRSHVAQWAIDRVPVWAALRREVPVSLTLGVATGIVISGIDTILQPALAPAWKNAAALQHRSIATTVLGILYGGITEELLIRWGLLSLLVWIAWLVFQRDDGPPRNATLWAAVIVSASIFGVGHLPAMQAAAVLNATIVLRTIGLNALAGIVFGWLYCRRSLEAAMIAHASTHIVFTLADASGLATIS